MFAVKCEVCYGIFELKFSKNFVNEKNAMRLKFSNFIQDFFRQTWNTIVIVYEAFNDILLFKFTLIVFINRKQLLEQE